MGICDQKIRKIFIQSIFVLWLISAVSIVSADVYVNILAVNGTEEAKEKEIKQLLPKELTVEDILDTGGLELEYDVDQKAYYVYGKIQLDGKQTKTFKIRVRDVWEVKPGDVDDVKGQIEESVGRLKNTEYYESAQKQRERLLGRLDYVVNQQINADDSVEQRIDRYRAYKQELAKIRDDAVSVQLWRVNPPEQDLSKTINYVIDVENTADVDKKVQEQAYLPSEVKPEHVIDAQGFDIRYDADKKQSFLAKEENLKAKEKKRYQISIRNVWNIAQGEIDNLRERSRKAYNFLKKTDSKESADYLVASIKANLGRVEESQDRQKDIKATMGDYQANIGFFEIARKDVESLEDLLQALREDLERSRLKNVLQKVKVFNSISEIAQAILGTKPSINNAWKIITWIVIFVGIVTLIYFVISAQRSKMMKQEDLKKVEPPPKEK